MTDIELLKMAAKAAGIKPASFDGINVGWYKPETGDIGSWNPLKNDGDALRLAVKLKLEIERSKYSDDSVYAGPPGTAPWKEEEDSEQDIYAATRRAIVRAAAEIGRSMP